MVLYRVPVRHLLPINTMPTSSRTLLMEPSPDPPLVTAVIGNWNGAAVLPDCLRTLREQTHRAIEVIVVDNASADASREVAAEFGARWIAMGRNAGLASALNRGAREARGEFVLFLNNDMRFHPRFVQALVDELQQRPDAFAADAVQYDWEGCRPIHEATYLATPGQGTAGVEVAPGLSLFQRSETSPVEVLTASGANLLARRRLFEMLGGFNASMFLGYEDLDLCWRARLRGWPIVYVPSAICWHRESVASNSNEGSPIRLRGTVLGRLIFTTQWLPLIGIVQAWGRALVAVGLDIARLRWSRAMTRGKAVTSALWLLPELLRTRRNGYAMATRTPAGFLNELRQIGDQR